MNDWLAVETSFKSLTKLGPYELTRFATTEDARTVSNFVASKIFQIKENICYKRDYLGSPHNHSLQNPGPWHCYCEQEGEGGEEARESENKGM